MKKLLTAIVMLGLGCLTLSAQKIVGGQTPEEKKNLEVATMEFKDMLQYGHLELADKVMARRTISNTTPTYLAGGRGSSSS